MMSGDAVGDQRAQTGIAFAHDARAPGRVIELGDLPAKPALKGLGVLAEVMQPPGDHCEGLGTEHRGAALGAAARFDQMLVQRLPVALIGPVAGVCVEFSDHPWPRVGSGHGSDARRGSPAAEITMTLDAPATAQSVRLTHGLPPDGPADTTAFNFVGQGAAQRSHRAPPLPSACNIRPLRLSGSILSNDE
ncbi:MAG: hypothetical protein NVV68_06430 [Dokdonella sp.]|nr:hypothetical protein [Dokdonella sp.]